MLASRAAGSGSAALASGVVLLAGIGIRATPAPQLASTAAASARRLLSSQASTSGGAATASTFSTSPWTSWIPYGRKITGTEKFYWGMFFVGAALITWRRWSQRETEEMRQERLIKEAELEQKRKDFLRAVLAGRSFLEGDDPFKGMRPRQIEKYVEEHKGELNTDDPFEGLSPEEIDEYVAKHGLQM